MKIELSPLQYWLLDLMSEIVLNKDFKFVNTIDGNYLSVVCNKLKLFYISDLEFDCPVLMVDGKLIDTVTIFQDDIIVTAFLCNLYECTKLAKTIDMEMALGSHLQQVLVRLGREAFDIYIDLISQKIGATNLDTAFVLLVKHYKQLKCQSQPKPAVI